jgi:hypothetical protein
MKNENIKFLKINKNITSPMNKFTELIMFGRDKLLPNPKILAEDDNLINKIIIPDKRNKFLLYYYNFYMKNENIKF